MILICNECGREYESTKSSRQFCSRKCSIDNRKKNPEYIKKLKVKKKKLIHKNIICKQCGNEFYGEESRQFCSTNCNNKYRFKDVKPIMMICKECEIEFRADRHRRLFCSNSCSNSFKGRDPKFQQKLKDAFVKRSKNPEYLKKLSIAGKKTWQNESFRKKMKDIITSDEWLDKVDKNSKHWKEYVLPSGKIVKVQGYENKALDILLEQHKETDLFIQRKEIESQIGKIFYIIDGREHLYIPDIYIKSKHKIVEVKSTWTYKSQLKKNLAKENRCKELGLDFEFMIL